MVNNASTQAYGMANPRCHLANYMQIHRENCLDLRLSYPWKLHLAKLKWETKAWVKSLLLLKQILFSCLIGEFGLTEPSYYYYLNQSGTYSVDGTDDVKDYEETRVSTANLSFQEIQCCQTAVIFV